MKRTTLLLALLYSCSLYGSAQDFPKPSDTKLVNISFAAIDKSNHVVTTIRREDIRLLEDGVSQIILALTQQNDSPNSIAVLVDTSSRKTFRQAIERAIKLDAVVYAIGLGSSEPIRGIGRSTLSKISELTGGQAFFPRKMGEFADALSQIKEELNARYVVSYQSASKKRIDAARKVKIEIINPELKEQDLKLVYRQSYFQD